MYKIYTTNRFEKDLKLCKKRNYDLNLLKGVIDLLQKDGKLPEKYKSHKLSGNFADCWNVTSNQIGCLFGNKMMKN